MTMARLGARTWIATVAIVIAQLAWAAPAARACECTPTSARLLWPRDEATSVPIDTPIVIQRRNSLGDPSELAIRLLDPQGAEVALEVVRTLEQTQLSCWHIETVFLRPAESLEANTAYVMHIGEGEGWSFTTGTELFEPSDYPSERLHYVHVGPQETCAAGALCNVADVLVSFDAPIDDGLWVTLRSAASMDNEDRAVYGLAAGMAQAPPGLLTVRLPDDDKCVELAMYGVDGAVVLERELCTPDSCVLYAHQGGSTCGEPPPSTLDAKRIPVLGCDPPTVIEIVSGRPVYPMPRDPEPDAGAGPTTDAGTPDRDAGEPPVSSSGGTSGSEAGASGASGVSGTSGVGGEPSAGEPDGDEDDTAATKRASGCSCNIARRQTGPLAAWALVMLALVRLARRRA